MVLMASVSNYTFLEHTNCYVLYNIQLVDNSFMFNTLMLLLVIFWLEIDHLMRKLSQKRE